MGHVLIKVVYNCFLLFKYSSFLWWKWNLQWCVCVCVCVCVGVCVCVCVSFHRKDFSWLKQNKFNARDQTGDVVLRMKLIWVEDGAPPRWSSLCGEGVYPLRSSNQSASTRRAHRKDFPWLKQNKCNARDQTGDVGDVEPPLDEAHRVVRGFVH